MVPVTLTISPNESTFFYFLGPFYSDTLIPTTFLLTFDKFQLDRGRPVSGHQCILLSPVPNLARQCVNSTQSHTQPENIFVTRYGLLR